MSLAGGICIGLDVDKIAKMAEAIGRVRRLGGRLFILGVGGGAANASHAVNDFRKMCGIEAYAPTDNVAELTARVNDDGWETWALEWLKTSVLNDLDALLIFSVGGGTKNVSYCLVEAVEWAKKKGATVLGVVGSEGGHTAFAGDVVVVVPQGRSDLVTAMTESFQALVWHCLVNHPALKQ
jgi:D-sedoheptulose 7-phosphate isomerase